MLLSEDRNKKWHIVELVWLLILAYQLGFIFFVRSINMPLFGMKNILKFVALKAVPAMLMIKVWLLDDSSLGYKLFSTAIVLITGFSYLQNHMDYRLFLLCVTVISAKGIDYKKITRLVAVLAVVFLGILVAMYLLGITSDGEFYRQLVDGSYTKRYTLGFKHPNTFGMWGLLIVSATVLSSKKPLKWYWYIVLAALMAVIYKLCDSRSSFIIAMAILVGVLVSDLLKKRLDECSWIPAVSVGICLIIPLMFYMCIYALKNNEPWAWQLNAMFSGRLQLALGWLQTEGISTIGHHINLKGTFLDDIYTYDLIVMGILPTLVWLGLMLKAVYRSAKNKNWTLVVIIMALFLYGTMERYMNCIVNIAMLAAFSDEEQKECDVDEERRKRIKEASR